MEPKMEQINNIQPNKSYSMILAWSLLLVSIFCLFLFNNIFLSENNTQNIKRPVNEPEPSSQTHITDRVDKFVNNIFLRPSDVEVTRLSSAEIMNPLAFLIYFILLAPALLSFFIGQYDILIRRKASVKFTDWIFSLISLFLVIVTIRLILITL
jgi:hypothetical protein